jgi:glucose-1-phosphate cytidylyltransferase
MKVVILCGGLGSRLAEETHIKPKPMIKIGNKPILSHITEIYEKNGFKEFILALGYKSHIIKKYYLKKKFKSKIQTIYTGKNTLTGGRLLKLKKYFKKGENFMLTYGDGLTNQNIKRLLSFHLKHKKIATMTVVRPPVRFGKVILKKNQIRSFREKPQNTTGWINGGFFVFNYRIFNFIKGDKMMLEREPMQKLVKLNQLMAFKHTGFWQCMDTMRDKTFLNKLYRIKKAPWIK